MTKCYLDSNVLVYWKNDQAPQHVEASDTLARLRQNDVLTFLSPLVLDEYVHAIIVEAKRHNARDPFDIAATAMRDALALPLLSIVNPPTDPDAHAGVVSLMKTYSLRPRDAYHLLTMQTNGIDGFATFDTDFTKVFAARLLMKA